MEKNKKFSLIIALSVLSILVILAISTNYFNGSSAIETYSNKSQSSSESLSRLMDGNKKFIYSSYNSSSIDSSLRKSLYENGQKPYAIILTCSDSRVVPEDIFYTGLGEIFVIRVAGNINGLSGSLEKTVEKIVPSYQKSKSLGGSDSEINERAINFNTENSINTIKENEVVKKHISDNSVMVVGAKYDLETGKVMLLDK